MRTVEFNLCCLAVIALGCGGSDSMPESGEIVVRYRKTVEDAGSRKKPDEPRRLVRFMGQEFVLSRNTNMNSRVSCVYVPVGESLKKWTKLLAVTSDEDLSDHFQEAKFRERIFRTVKTDLDTRLSRNDAEDTTVLELFKWHSDSVIEIGILVFRSGTNGAGVITKEYRHRETVRDRDENLDELNELREKLLRQVLASEFPSIPAPAHPNQDTGPMPIYVTPFYNSRGPLVNTGQFDAELMSVTLQSMPTLEKKLVRYWDQLSVETMFVVAIRLYDLGLRKKATVWFYSANVRARLFKAVAEGAGERKIGSPAFEYASAHSSFNALTSPYINGYAFGDLAELRECLLEVQSRTEELPDFATTYSNSRLQFIDTDEWRRELKKIHDELRELSEKTIKDAEEIKAARKKNGLENRS